MQATDKIDEYMSRLRDLAGHEDHINRFYLFQEEDFYDLELEIANSDQAQAFYDQLFNQYRAWRDQMGSEKWQEVLDCNDALNDASRNWVLDEL